MLRLLWLSQLLELIYRSKRHPHEHIPPSLIDFYLLASVAIELCFGLSTYSLMPLYRQLSAWIVALCLTKILECLTSNVYYLLLRPMLEVKAPHSIYRSFLLACVGIVEILLLFALAWLFGGDTKPVLDSFLTALYFVAATLFTVGYGDYAPQGEFSHALAIFTMLAGAAMLAVVLSRAVSIIRPLPERDSVE